MQSQLSLSEAILLGSTMIKPRRGVVIAYETKADLSRERFGCALGMAHAAGGYMSNKGFCNIPDYSHFWATLNKQAVTPCDCGKSIHYRCSVLSIITHLFDAHVVIDENQPMYTPWTLEQLVDWVRTQETQVPDIQEEKQLTENTAVAV